MKKILISIIFISLLLPGVSFAALTTPTSSSTTTPEPTSKANGISQQIDALKNKVASRVAQLKLVEKMGTIGTVQSSTDTQIVIDDINGKTRIIDVDEITNFSSDSNKSYDISNIKKGSKISVLGLYNKDSERLLARFINEVTIPLFLNGVVSSTDSDNFTFTLSQADGTSFVVSVEDVTRTYSYKVGDLQTSGFSKIKEMQNAIVVGFPDPKDKNKITASRVIILPNTPKDPSVSIVPVTPSLSPTPTK